MSLKSFLIILFASNILFFPHMSVYATANALGGGSKLYITFDDCYTNWSLIASRYKDCQFTFFLSGELLPYRVNIIKQLLDNNHSIQNHSISHKNLVRIAKSKRETFLQQDILKHNILLGELGVASPSIFAFPYGESDKDWNKRLLAHFKKLRGVGTFLNFPHYYKQEEFEKTSLIKSAKLYNYRFPFEFCFKFYINKMIKKMASGSFVVVLTTHQVGNTKYGITLSRLDYIVKVAKKNNVALVGL